MNNYKFSNKSWLKLEGINPRLIATVTRALMICEIDFTVLEGMRDKKRQRELYKIGASQTLDSRHLTGHAVDLGAWINNTISWDFKYYRQIAAAMIQAATELDVIIEWGGNWSTFKDGPHFQLPLKN